MISQEPSDARASTQPGAAPTPLDHAVARLEAWLETMRGPEGYGGPVAHWWQQSLLYTGPGFDWRYEGIIAGYLALWERGGDPRWLAKARRAGDDLLHAQGADGHFASSAFELNPAPAGTPHEAACDLGLLLLATALRKAGQSSWQSYAGCAARNLRMFYIEQLWDAHTRAFRDSPFAASFVPNKAATACEALLLLAELSGDESLATYYALPTLDHLLDYQQRGPGPLAGAIAQNRIGAQVVPKYFPIYIARCIPALVRAHAYCGNERYLKGALQALAFITRQVGPGGALPTAIYANGRAATHPAWVAPLGDVLRAAELLRPHGFDGDLGAVEARLLAGQDASGGIQTATGFAAQAGGRPGRRPDVRDLLHVAGWCDKAFRYLAGQAGPALPAATSAPFEAECSLRGRALLLRETPEALEISGRDGLGYSWRKGERWARVAREEFWLR